MNKILKIIGWCIAILFIIYLIYGLYLHIKTEAICHNECNASGGLYSEKIGNGKLDTNDLCICYFEEGSKSWKLGEGR